MPRSGKPEVTSGRPGYASRFLRKEFLLDSKCCIINGRITPEYDNPTFVSTRGTSVVDYIVTPHDCIKQVTKCTVDLCSDIMTELGIENMISDMCKAPDHSLVTVTFQISPYVCLESRMLGARNYSSESQHGLKYKVCNLPCDFMNSEQFCQLIIDLIDEINVGLESQDCVDEMYNKLVKAVQDEMGEKLTPLSKGGRRKFLLVRRVIKALERSAFK